MQLNKATIAATIAAALVIALAGSVPPSSAQSRGGMGAFGRVPARSVVRAPLVGTPLYPNFARIPGGSAAVPGPGFDYDHVVAVDRGHLDRHFRVRRNGFITPIFFAGDLPLYDYDDTDYGNRLQPLQQPTVIVLQQPRDSGAVQASPPPPEAVPASAAPETAAKPETPVKDVGEFILVRRDGQVTLAVAFTTAGGRVTYVTREGTRRSFPVAELDNEATRQMNDANGTTLSLPN